MSEPQRQEAPPPQGDYLPATRHDSLIFTAGMTPRKLGKLIFDAPVHSGVDVECYREAVSLAAENALNAALTQIQPGERISGVLSLTVYIAADQGFRDHSLVADLASSFLRSKLGAVAAIGSRAAVGVLNLPSNAPVEVQLIACVTSD